MKRDMELVRKILLFLEENSNDDFMELIKIEGYAQEEIDYHVNIMLDGKLLKGTLFCGGDKVIAHTVNMTWEGHDFLDSIRDNNIWNKTKEGIKSKGLELGSIPFEVLKSYAKLQFKSMFGIE